MLLLAIVQTFNHTVTHHDLAGYDIRVDNGADVYVNLPLRSSLRNLGFDGPKH